MEKCACPVHSSFTMACVKLPSEGAGLDRTLERQLLSPHSARGIGFEQPCTRLPPNINGLLVHLLAPARSKVMPPAPWCHRPHGATGPCRVAPSRSRSSSPDPRPGLQSWDANQQLLHGPGHQTLNPGAGPIAKCLLDWC